jgi:hypothetical protein
MSLTFLKDFALVGGTALSLKMGHRKSIDLDLFSTVKFDQDDLYDSLKSHFNTDVIREKSFKNFALFAYIRKVKVDFVYHPQHLLKPSLEIIDGIRMFSNDDIAAMKIQAILGRGQKKDFWDIHELINEFGIEAIISMHHAKYPDQFLAISIPNALTYFNDADDSDEPFVLNSLSWNQVKSNIQSKVREYLS